jgi:hypothetical protein
VGSLAQSVRGFLSLSFFRWSLRLVFSDVVVVMELARSSVPSYVCLLMVGVLGSMA